MSSRPLDIGAKLSRELTWNRGAALGTEYLTYREDSLLESASERYTMRHYESWVALARHKDYGNDVQPVLISGVDMTRDLAIVAYSYEETSLESDMTFFFQFIFTMRRWYAPMLHITYYEFRAGYWGGGLEVFRIIVAQGACPIPFVDSDATIIAPMLISASASLWGTWRTRHTPHTNHGP